MKTHLISIILSLLFLASPSAYSQKNSGENMFVIDEPLASDHRPIVVDVTKR